jgi:hypothetical protein
MQNVSHTSTPASATASSVPRMKRIATRAHEIYEARGGQHGKALDDWLRAEREIDEEDEALEKARLAST